MKRDNKLLKALNALLAKKFTTINQFVVHSEICDKLGYSDLHKAIQKLAMDQMLLAEWLIERICFLEGSPCQSNLNALLIEKTVSGMNKNTGDKQDTLNAYYEAIELARDAEDHHTADLLNSILLKDEGQLAWAQIQREQIEQKGLENHLITRAECAVN